jgi:hypothetical protein
MGDMQVLRLACGSLRMTLLFWVVGWGEKQIPF